jgi:hypothetical protein
MFTGSVTVILQSSAAEGEASLKFCWSHARSLAELAYLAERTLR